MMEVMRLSYEKSINLLKAKGIEFETGLTGVEMEKIESTHKIEFPKSLKMFLMAVLPVSRGFYNWRNFDEDNISMTIKGQDAVKICREVIETVAASYKLQVELRFDTSLTSLMISKISFTKIGERPMDGSSIRMIFGWLISARPMASICCSPPLKVPAV